MHIYFKEAISILHKVRFLWLSVQVHWHTPTSSSHPKTVIPWPPPPNSPPPPGPSPCVSHHCLLSWPSQSQMDPQGRFLILSSDSSTQDLLTKPPSVTFHQLIVDKSLCPHSPATPIGSRPWNRPWCKTCPIHQPANSFTSSPHYYPHWLQVHELKLPTSVYWM